MIKVKSFPLIGKGFFSLIPGPSPSEEGFLFLTVLIKFTSRFIRSDLQKSRNFKKLELANAVHEQCF